MKKKYEKDHTEFDNGRDILSSFIILSIVAVVMITIFGIVLDNQWLLSFLKPIIKALVV